MRQPQKVRSSIASVVLRRYLRKESRRCGNFVVCGFPKSGTTWVSQLIAEACGFDYRRNDIRLRFSNVLLHTHGVRFQGGSNLLYVVRDPREVICSAARTVPASRRSAVYDRAGYIRREFADLTFDAFPGATCDFATHLAAARDNNWSFIRFEDLKRDTVFSLTTALAECGYNVAVSDIERAERLMDFGRLKTGASTDRFLAQSSVESWKTLLPPKVINMLDERLGRLAATFGYDLQP